MSNDLTPRYQGGRLSTLTGHSEAPWQMVPSPAGIDIATRALDPVTDARHLFVARIYTPGPYDNKLWDVLTLPEALANAALVIAAPDMLRAAWRLVESRTTAPTANGQLLESWEHLRASVVKAMDVEAVARRYRQG